MTNNRLNDICATKIKMINDRFITINCESWNMASGTERKQQQQPMGEGHDRGYLGCGCGG